MKRIAWLTLAVFTVTGAFTAAQWAVPELLGALCRQPSMIANGEIWRFVTAWLVHDEGLKQIAVNFPALAVAGTLAEMAFERRAWAAAYLLAGLTGEVAGLWWQPVGAGNSVAILGLVGLLLGWQSRWPGQPAWRRLLAPALALAGSLWLIGLRDIHGPALLMGLIVGQMAVRMPALVRGRP